MCSAKRASNRASGYHPAESRVGHAGGLRRSGPQSPGRNRCATGSRPILGRHRSRLNAEAARIGAPMATQIADRCHLLLNISEALRGIVERQQSTVRAAITQPWSNGPSKVRSTAKLIKRQMYGRYGLDLLQQRGLHAA